MNTFTWLLLGHLIGDWMFQNDWMARNKQSAFFTVAGLAHFIIYTLCVSAVLILWTDLALLPSQIILFSSIVFITHWLIDATNLARIWAGLIQQTDVALVRIAVDQTFHLLVLALLIKYLL